MLTPYLFICLLFIALISSNYAVPVELEERFPLGELEDGSKIYILREKRQWGGGGGGQRYPGQGGYQGYAGGRPGGRPQGGRPPGGFNQGGFQQPSFAAGAANAQAQGFQTGNGLGANHAGTITQGFAAGPGGITGSGGAGFSQNYNFPNGISASVSGTGTFGVGPGGATQGGGHAVTVTGPGGRPLG